MALTPSKGYSMAMHFCMNILVGAGLGYSLDQCLNSLPWGLLGGLFLGFAAGLRFMLKVAQANQVTPITSKVLPYEDEKEKEKEK